MFTGGILTVSSIFIFGIMPYISSIVIQLLGMGLFHTFRSYKEKEKVVEGRSTILQGI